MERDGRRKRSRGSRTLANRARNAHAALVPNARWRPGLGQRRSDGQRLGPPVRVEASHAMDCSGHERRGAMVGGQLWASPDSVATIVPLGIARAPSWAGWGQRCCGPASARPAFVVPAAAIPAGAHGPGLERARPNPAAGSFLRPSLVTSTDASEAMPRLTCPRQTTLPNSQRMEQTPSQQEKGGPHGPCVAGAIAHKLPKRSLCGSVARRLRAIALRGWRRRWQSKTMFVLRWVSMSRAGMKRGGTRDGWHPVCGCAAKQGRGGCQGLPHQSPAPESGRLPQPYLCKLSRRLSILAASQCRNEALARPPAQAPSFPPTIDPAAGFWKSCGPRGASAVTPP